ncbi:hypothetical protein GCM10010095_55180 [Streptomyces anthocyanicus]|uniref:DUF4192 domain-containing protein n=2 Tax=Streptomyces violaceoruber group TaxID=2867121 RepID=A0ABN3SI86_9ACTN|nr:DUF4192 domain-containing protein [Streptomyces anthocyanicus]GGL63080.1 hypothetical protein GCM10010095_55180 [Streptomyces anthocyanicus]
MTNHSETTGSSENGDISRAAERGRERADGPMPESPADEHQVTLRTPAELADALPYLLGYRPEDSIVLAALRDRDGRGRFGGRARLGIPASPDDWAAAAGQLVHGLVTGSERRGVRPEQMVAYLCQEPRPGETGRKVMERLRPLAQKLRVECGALDIPVVEALCISDGRFWSYCCDEEDCCPADGLPVGLPGTSVLAAAATYAGIQVRGSLTELRARMLPREHAMAAEQAAALDAAATTLVARILDAGGRAEVAEETLETAERIMRRLAGAPPVSGAPAEDERDDQLLGHDEAAALILGLQDRTTRDRAAAWMEGAEAAPAMRLWRALARRCVGPYGEHAAAPLTLAGWVAWSTGDELEAREALAMALGADPDYLFARLLHQACNEGLDPESIRRCLREGREGGQSTGDTTADDDGRGGAAVEGEREAEPEPEPARPLSAAPPRRRRRERSLASPSGVRRRTRSGGHRPGTETMPPRTMSLRTTPGVGHPGIPRTGRTRPHAPATPVTDREDTRPEVAGPEVAGPGERGSHGDRECS